MRMIRSWLRPSLSRSGSSDSLLGELVKPSIRGRKREIFISTTD
uniref:Uncharacterized protein n=1 Tax=Nelumbo nucifera TaxID=4432 RepID=A0A822XGY6_NELNU|nr:TPA_asm: hypothetical protein HUJ06_021113 [Nelumbo nucifera]